MSETMYAAEPVRQSRGGVGGHSPPQTSGCVVCGEGGVARAALDGSRKPPFSHPFNNFFVSPRARILFNRQCHRAVRLARSDWESTTPLKRIGRTTPEKRLGVHG